MGLHARTDYTKGSLNENELPSDPCVLLIAWLDDAVSSGMQDPTAFALSTVDEWGYPHSRIVLLRDTRQGELVFFTNYESEKGQDLARNAKAGATFFWPSLERQIRVRGSVTRVSQEESDRYFASRPRESQLGAWSSDQSRSIASRESLDRAFAARLQEYPEGHVPRPPHWGGYAILPVEVEFWQGRASRMHDRIRYRRAADGSWEHGRLQP